MDPAEYEYFNKLLCKYNTSLQITIVYYIINYLLTKSLNNIFNVLINKFSFMVRIVYFQSEQKTNVLLKRTKKSRDTHKNVV